MYVYMYLCTKQPRPIFATNFASQIKANRLLSATVLRFDYVGYHCLYVANVCTYP